MEKFLKDVLSDPESIFFWVGIIILSIPFVLGGLAIIVGLVIKLFKY